MLIVAYDIHNDKLRTKFGKLLKKFGRRVQYSVFEVKNSERILSILKTEIENIYAPKFSGADSILIFPISDAVNKKVLRYGQPAMEEEELLFL
ncbi:CRISPR-associated endonuclease Cas2 [Candidatus Gracilibacteria bacterium HOT-871]|nr:CRISPR-associated endonuclease Cas2 [Candidatus Gracilibacteria bacterium HOT-871]MBB1565330.1 CRISPR-associated endonuclease Cas2 [Candidatus Gracilibacteria bacterium]RKW25050.1 MAG: CRISPR-associated endonuclease Cas2 [Candidatus Gracilibacteria bacterium]